MKLSNKDSWVREYRAVNIKTSDGLTFTGKINLVHHQRISDLFNDPCTQFIILVDVIKPETLDKPVLINKYNIVWAEPGD